MARPRRKQFVARLESLSEDVPGNTFVLGLCLLLVAGAAVPLTAAADGHQITPETSVDTPTRTVTVAGDSFTVDSTAYVRAGEDLTVAVDIPGGDRYQVVLYNSDRQVEERVTKVEDGTVSFETDGRPAGSYVVTVWEDRELHAILPVAISGYDITVDAPEAVTAGSSATVTATLSSVSDAPEDPEHVNVTVFNDTWDGSYTATESGGEYTADLPETLATGEYTVYVTAHSDEEYYDRYEISGLSHPSTVTVTAEDSTEGNADGGSGDGEGNADGSDGDSPSDTPTSTSTTEEPNVIEPADATETTAPGFPVLGFALLALAAAWTQLRSRGRS